MKRIPHPQHASKSALSADQILGVAVAVADREGITAVSMRRLARELSVTPLALYWHFNDNNGLLDGMAEMVIADGDFNDVPDDAWDQRLRAVLTTLVGLLPEHPWMGRLLIERVGPLPRYLTALEIMLDSARQAANGKPVEPTAELEGTLKFLLDSSSSRDASPSVAILCADRAVPRDPEIC